VAQDFDQVTLAVADDGRGIAAADRGEALRRFGRLDPARQRPGSGLGLSLVEATARLHGGTIELADNFPGLVVRLRLPNVR
jgi:signal transduction histidine kinase